MIIFNLTKLQFTKITMKLYLASFAILSTAHLAHGLCLKEALTSNGTLTTDNGIPCSFGKFKTLLNTKMKELSDCGSINDELLDIFNAMKIRRVAQMFRASCNGAPEPDQSATSSFRDIFQSFNTTSSAGELDTDDAQDRFLKEFYDGNTFINQYVGNGPYKIPNADISSFHRNSASKAIIDWPGNNGSFDNFDVSDSCKINTVMCCWVTDRKINNDDNNGNCKAPYPKRKTSDGSGCKDADPADNT
jgi:hypothetical protein